MKKVFLISLVLYCFSLSAYKHENCNVGLEINGVQTSWLNHQDEQKALSTYCNTYNFLEPSVAKNSTSNLIMKITTHSTDNMCEGNPYLAVYYGAKHSVTLQIIDNEIKRYNNTLSSLSCDLSSPFCTFETEEECQADSRKIAYEKSLYLVKIDMPCCEPTK